MGITKGIFTVDTHTHAQRYAVKFQEKGVKPEYAALTDTMNESVCYDNSPRMLYHMDRYDVNMCIIQPSFSMTNELNMEIVKNHPGRFAALCNDARTHQRARDGIKPWNLKDSLAEIEELLATGMFVGIGEVGGGALRADLRLHGAHPKVQGRGALPHRLPVRLCRRRLAVQNHGAL